MHSGVPVPNTTYATCPTVVLLDLCFNHLCARCPNSSKPLSATVNAVVAPGGSRHVNRPPGPFANSVDPAWTAKRPLC